MRNAAMALAATVAGMTTTSCEEDEILQEQPKKEQIQKHNVVLVLEQPFSVSFNDSFNRLRDLDNIKKIASAMDVDSVIVTPEVSEHWGALDAFDIRMIKEDCLEPLFNSVSNVYGKGDFNFKSGEASRQKNDSIWYINHGFTINAKTR